MRLTAALAAEREAQPILAVTIEETVDEDAASATPPPPTRTAAASAPESIGDDDGPVWPDEATESAMRAEIVERGETVVTLPAPTKAAHNESEEDDADGRVTAGSSRKPLPELDELVNRLPADVRETLEDLFRAKFVKVTRVPTKALKTETT